VTASALEEDANRCMESGFDDIIHKPIDIHLLTKKMGQLIQRKKEKMEQATNTDRKKAEEDETKKDGQGAASAAVVVV
jgi:DNA-binding response OmpR family regulator